MVVVLARKLSCYRYMLGGDGDDEDMVRSVLCAGPETIVSSRAVRDRVV